MEKDRKFRALAIAAICVAVVGVSVAYAALQATLSIEGTASVGTLADAWDIHWENVQVTAKDSSITWTKAPVISVGNTQEITWEAQFTAPNTSLTFTADIVNDGTLNAKLLDGTYVNATGDIASSFTYTVKVGDADISAKKGNILLSEATKTVTVTVKLNDMENAAFEALADKSATFTLTLPFEQAADGEVTPEF